MWYNIQLLMYHMRQINLIKVTRRLNRYITFMDNLISESYTVYFISVWIATPTNFTMHEVIIYSLEF